MFSRTVFPDAVKSERWWTNPGTTHLILSEYVKYQAALLRAWLNGPEAAS